MASTGAAGGRSLPAADIRRGLCLPLWGPSAPTDIPLLPGASSTEDQTSRWAAGSGDREQMGCPAWAVPNSGGAPDPVGRPDSTSGCLVGPSGLSFSVCTMGTFMDLAGLCRFRDLWLGTCFVNYKGLCVRVVPVMGQSPYPPAHRQWGLDPLAGPVH